MRPSPRLGVDGPAAYSSVTVVRNKHAERREQRAAYHLEHCGLRRLNHLETQRGPSC